MFKLVLGVIFGMISSTHAAESYLQSQLREGLKLLPVAYSFTVRPKALASDSLMGEDLCQLGPKVKFALTRRRGQHHEIEISQRLLDLAQKNKRTFDCSHGSFKKLLLAVIVHEFTHVRDNFERLSLDPDFQRIVGVKKTGRSGKSRPMGRNAMVSPDAYEFENLEESLAVNAEFLLLDPEYECRRPALASFLAKRLGLALKGSCKKSYAIVTQSSYIEDNYLRPATIDPARIWQVHYLFAGKGEAIMSRWGHAMFRLVVCAPHRRVLGPDCMKDVSHHLVLSYRAYITGMELNYLKGLKGDYPSQLFIMRFHEVQQEYTKLELRDLYSIPLKLTPIQKAEFIDLTLERFWTYQGKYYFLDNNCGTEAQKHLAAALDERQSGLIHSLTPSRMYKDIVKERNGLTAERVEALTRQEMVRRGLLMERMTPEFQKSFNELRAAGLLTEKSWDKFLKKTSAKKRLDSYLEADRSILSRLAPRILHLERFLALRFSAGLPKKAVKLMGRNAALKAEVMRLSTGLKVLGTQPWEIVKSKYGIPLVSEFETQYPEFAKQRSIEAVVSMKEQMLILQGVLGKKSFAKELGEMETHGKIKEFITSLNLPQEIQ